MGPWESVGQPFEPHVPSTFGVGWSCLVTFFSSVGWSIGRTEAAGRVQTVIGRGLNSPSFIQSLGEPHHRGMLAIIGLKGQALHGQSGLFAASLPWMDLAKHPHGQPFSGLLSLEPDQSPPPCDLKKLYENP